MLIAGKMMWKDTVKANCHRARRRAVSETFMGISIWPPVWAAAPRVRGGATLCLRNDCRSHGLAGLQRLAATDGATRTMRAIERCKAAQARPRDNLYR